MGAPAVTSDLGFDIEALRKQAEQNRVAATNAVETVTAPAVTNAVPSVAAPAPDSTYVEQTGKLLSAAQTETAPATPAIPAGGKLEVSLTETAPADSDAVKIGREQEQYKMETALRLKGLDTALALWKEQRADAKALRDRELDFADWQKKYDVQNRDKMIEKLSGARDTKWEYHGTFANGVLTSHWSGTSTNPYKEMIKELGGTPGGESGTGGRAGDGGAFDSSKFEPPDWLKGLLPEGLGTARKAALELNAKPTSAASGDRKVKSVLSAYTPAGSFLGVDASGNSLFGERTKTTSTLYSDGTSTLKKGKTNVLFRAAPDRNNALARLLENME